MLLHSKRNSDQHHTRQHAISVLGRLGGHALAERWTRRVPRILMFHRFATLPAWRKTSLENLCRILDAIATGYRVITLDEAVVCLKQQRTSPRDVVLTVDDAYEDFHRIALPEFESRGFPVTLYVPTDFVDRRAWLWPDRLLWIVRATTRDVLQIEGLGELPLRTLADRRFAWNSIADVLVSQAHVERECLLSRIEALLGVRTPALPTDDYRAMTWNQIRDAASRGVCVASQAGAHVPLSRESAETQLDEARRSKIRLESEVGREVRHFSYPHGRLEDFDEISISAAKSAGYHSAAAAVPEAGCSHPFVLPRISVPDSVADLRRLMSGISQLSQWSASP